MNEFLQGAACAIAVIVKGHGPSTETREALQAVGLTSWQVAFRARVSNYDIEVLWPKEYSEYKAKIKAAIDMNDGHKAAATKYLGKGIKQFYNELHQLEML